MQYLELSSSGAGALEGVLGGWGSAQKGLEAEGQLDSAESQ